MGTSTLCPSPAVRRHDPNHAGRDFVVGDLHGCSPWLRILLDRVRFTPSRDRLFMVGDLIDRGPDVNAMDWLDEPGVFVAMGNHEHALWHWLETGDFILWETQEWVEQWMDAQSGPPRRPDLARSWLQPLRERLSQMPLIHAVGLPGPGGFVVLHAERIGRGIGVAWSSLSDAAIVAAATEGLPDTVEIVDEWPDPNAGWTERLLWGRCLQEMARSPGARNVVPPALADLGIQVPTYVGHSITPLGSGRSGQLGLQGIAGHVAMDTGAAATWAATRRGQPAPGGGLTMVQVADPSSPSAGLPIAAWQAHGDGVVTVDPAVTWRLQAAQALSVRFPG